MTDWFQIGKGVCQGCIVSPCSFTLYAEYIMRNARLDEAQAGIKITRRKINNLRYADDICISATLMAESKEELKSHLIKVKEESEKAGLKLNIRKINSIWPHYFMTNRWGNNGNSNRLYFLGSIVIADVDHTHEIRRHLLLGRKTMTNLDSILKSRDIILMTKVHIVKAMVFPVIMCGCESWTIHKEN